MLHQICGDNYYIICLVGKETVKDVVGIIIIVPVLLLIELKLS